METIMGSKKSNKKRVAMLIAVALILGVVLFGTATNYLGAFKLVPSSATVTISEYTAALTGGQIVAAGTEDLLVGTFKVAATDDDYEISELTLSVDSEVADNISYLMVKYPTDLLTPDALDGENSVYMDGETARFSSLGMEVPADDFAYLELYATLTAHTNDAGGLDSDEVLNFTLDSFEAISLEDGSVVTDTPGITTSDSIYVYRSIPTVANKTELGTTLVTGQNQEIYRFSITADSNGDIIYQYVSFDVAYTGLVESGTTNSLSNNLLGCVIGTSAGASKTGSTYDYTNAPVYMTEYGKSTVVGIGCYNTKTDRIKIDTNVSSGTTTSGVVIGAGSTKTFSVYADIFEDSDTSTISTISTRLHLDTSHTAATTVEALKKTAVGMIWSDYGSASGTHGVGVAEWMNGYKVPGMPVSYVTLS